jgi:hypothetical protein
MTCRFVSTTEPRVVAGRHATPCACDDRELGCLPCPETHCLICGRAHAKAACTACLDAARSDLKAIMDLCLSLPAEAVEKGVQSEAMMLLGPSSDPEAWRNRATSAMVGRLDASYLEDCRDELHPLWVLGTWEQVWRDHLDHSSIAPVTVTSAHAYLDMQIGYMSEQVEPAFDEFARELRGCRAHLENVLHDGIREERGAPCVQCEKPMVRVGDDWHCRTCHRVATEAEYRFAVGVAYRAHAPHLTAADLAERIGVKASVIRVWGARDSRIKRGRNHLGITLYDVASVIAKRDNTETEQAG